MDLVTDALKNRYREPQRRYHTLQHIEELLGLLDAHAVVLADPEAVRLAIWYHDAVYDPKAPKGENERLSAALFDSEWHAAGKAEDDRFHAVRAMILATIDHDLARSHPPDSAWFLDFDMAILGAADARYRQYAGQVRGEYETVPDELYRQGRSAFLRGALAKPVLYCTDAFRDACDARARRNMTWELESLLG